MTTEKITEWNGITGGQACTVLGGNLRSEFLFIGYFTPASGKPYVEVIEQKNARSLKNKGSRTSRIIAPEKVSPLS